MFCGGRSPASKQAFQDQNTLSFFFPRLHDGVAPIGQR
jgi:hypothetical protein